MRRAKNKYLRFWKKARETSIYDEKHGQLFAYKNGFYSVRPYGFTFYQVKKYKSNGDLYIIKNHRRKRRYDTMYNRNMKRRYYNGDWGIDI